MKTTNELGLIHIYCGDGKGKTTSAIGTALRAIGNEYKVVIIQFLKNGTSSEINVLRKFPNVRIFADECLKKFSFDMSDIEKQECRKKHNEFFNIAVELCNNSCCDLLVLDEIIGTLNKNLIEKDLVIEFLKNKPKNIEIIMTGKNPTNELTELADYVSEIKKIKHPYDKGISARIGIEK